MSNTIPIKIAELALEVKDKEIATLKSEVEELTGLLKASTYYNTSDEVTRLKAEVERLTALVESNLNQSKVAMANSDASVRTLKAQVERLTKAGDELHAFLINYIVESRISSAYLNKLDDAWNAAKEGKQS